MVCQVCERQVPTRAVSLQLNVGMLIMRSHRAIKGNLCRACTTRFFWEFTLITATLGWWGLISFFLTPIFLVNNGIQLIKGRALPPAPPQWQLAASSSICPRCQAPALQPERFGTQPLIALGVGIVFIAWGLYLLFLRTAANNATGNRIIGAIVLVMGIVAIAGFMLLQRSRMRICLQCQLRVPAQ